MARSLLVRTPQGAISHAGETLRDLRVAEVAELDMQLDKGSKVEAYRAELRVSSRNESQ